MAMLALESAAQDPMRSDFSGVWSFPLSNYDDPAWTLKDLVTCYYCVQEAFDYFHEMLEDPSKRDWSADQLREATVAFHVDFLESRRTDAGRRVLALYDPADDPAINCEPFGVYRYIHYPHAFLLEQHDDRVVFKYEYGGVERVVYMDGRDHPPNLQPSKLGHSIGWIEGDTLVVETVGAAPELANHIWFIHTSEQARGIERYTLSDDGHRLDLEFVLDDPVMFREPIRVSDGRIRSPLEYFEVTQCEVIAGQF
jgi:hypothetical protein